MFKDINISEAMNLPNNLLVDVRSEAEYLHDTIPGAVNIPVLNNEERAAVGLTYHHEGPVAALKLGFSLVSPKLTAKLSTVQDLAGQRSLTVFCWRGGQRSYAMAQFFTQSGCDVYRITGGYKAYRRYVLDYLENRESAQRSIVLHGLTGVGKTDVLTRLSEKGLPVLDLEQMARHRGSVFGKIGLPPSPSQKAFESQIVRVLEESAHRGFFLVECESRKVGNLLTPGLVMDYIRRGVKILLYCGMEQRIKRIKDVYAGSHDDNVAALQKATASLTRLLGRTRVEELNERLVEKDYDRVIAFMLEHHYDPLYNYPCGPATGYDLCVDTDDIEKAAATIHGYVLALNDR